MRRSGRANINFNTDREIRSVSLISAMGETYTTTYIAEFSWKMGTRMKGGRANDTSCCALIKSNSRRKKRNMECGNTGVFLFLFFRNFMYSKI